MRYYIMSLVKFMVSAVLHYRTVGRIQKLATQRRGHVRNFGVEDSGGYTIWVQFPDSLLDVEWSATRGWVFETHGGPRGQVPDDALILEEITYLLRNGKVKRSRVIANDPQAEHAIALIYGGER